MNVDTKHTAGPLDWRPRKHVTNESAVVSSDPVADNGGFVVAHTYGPRHVENARFIVAACNLHDDLVAALAGLQANPNDPRAHRKALDVLRQAGEE